MTPPSKNTWKRLDALLDEVLELPPDQRAAILAERCSGNLRLRVEVDALVAADQAAAGFLAIPAVEYARVLVDPDGSASSGDGESDPAGQVIGPYRIVRQIGRGGMGVVSLAVRADGHFDQQVALKVLKRGMDSEEILLRFLQERQILARLRHPHIAALLDGGMSGSGVPYFAMEYVDGTPITVFCESRGLQIDDRLELFQQVCDAVQHAHTHLVVHRDLKPSNILVTLSGEVKLLDFGIARLLDDSATAAPVTRAPLRLMTPEYAAPEQLRGEPVTTAADVYALGVLLHELLTGRTPSQPGPTRLARDLQAIVGQALRDDPRHRYSSAAALADDVRRYRVGWPVSSRHATLSYRAGRFLARHTVGVTVAALLLATLVAGLAGTIWQARVAAEEARKALEVKAFLLDLFEVTDPERSRGEAVTARELLDRGAERVERELTGQPAVQAEMMGLVGMIYQRLGLYDRARPLVERALALRRGLYGENHLAVSELTYHLGTVARSQGRYDEAATLLQHALVVQRAQRGERHQDVAETLNDLALTFNDLGQFDEAVSAMREVQDIVRHHYGDDHLRMGIVLNDLAFSLERKGDLAAAESAYRQSLAIKRRLLDPGHPSIAISVHNLARLLHAKGDVAAAKPLAREALELRQRLLGEDHPEVALTTVNLARILLDTGAYDEAGTLMQRALAMQRQRLGDDHPHVAWTLTAVGDAHRVQGRAREAEHSYREALAILGSRTPGHVRVATTLVGLGQALAATARSAEARSMLDEAVRIRTSAYGADHRLTVEAQRALDALPRP